MLSHILVDAGDEFVQILLPESQAGGIDMSAIVLEKVCTAADRLIEVEASDTPGRAGDETVGAGQDKCRLVIFLDQAGGNDAHHALVPVRGIDHHGIAGTAAGAVLDHVECLRGYFPVNALALVVVVIDFLSDLKRLRRILGGEEFDSQAARLHPSGRIDPGTYLEYDIVDGDVSGLKVGELNHCLESRARPLIQHLEAEMRQHPVLPGHAHQVGGYADYQKVKQRKEILERDPLLLRICLYKLEAHPAA